MCRLVFRKQFMVPGTARSLNRIAEGPRYAQCSMLRALTAPCSVPCALCQCSNLSSVSPWQEQNQVLWPGSVAPLPLHVCSVQGPPCLGLLVSVPLRHQGGQWTPPSVPYPAWACQAQPSWGSLPSSLDCNCYCYCYQGMVIPL